MNFFKNNIDKTLERLLNNFLSKISDKKLDLNKLKQNYIKILKVFYPIIPHIISECLKSLREDNKLFWPEIEREYLVEDNVNIGGLVGVHQFCRIGEGSMIGAHAMVSKDVIPFSMIIGMRPVLSGVNLVGLKRRGCKKENMKKLVELFSKIFDKKGNQNFQERLEAMNNDVVHEVAEVRKVLDFLTQETTRSFVAPKS